MDSNLVVDCGIIRLIRSSEEFIPVVEFKFWGCNIFPECWVVWYVCWIGDTTASGGDEGLKASGKFERWMLLEFRDVPWTATEGFDWVACDGFAIGGGGRDFPARLIRSSNNDWSLSASCK